MAIRERSSQTVTIANGATDSTGIDARGMASGSFLTPAAFTSTAITFKGSLDNSTWVALYTSANAAVGVATVTTSRAYPIPQQCFDWPYIQIVGGSSEGGARSIVVSMNG